MATAGGNTSCAGSPGPRLPTEIVPEIKTLLEYVKNSRNEMESLARTITLIIAKMDLIDDSVSKGVYSYGSNSCVSGGAIPNANPNATLQMQPPRPGVRCNNNSQIQAQNGLPGTSCAISNRIAPPPNGIGLTPNSQYIPPQPNAPLSYMPTSSPAGQGQPYSKQYRNEPVRPIPFPDYLCDGE